MTTVVGVGVVGLGAISKYWLEAIEAHPSTILAAVCDTRPPCDSDAYSVPFYTDHKLLLEDTSVSVVVIDTPPHTHFRIIADCFAAKKAVIVEKPVCTTLEDGLKCLDLAREHQTPLYLAWHSKFGAAALKMKALVAELINEGETIEAFTVNAKLDVRKYHDGASWVFNKAVSGGGCLIDSAINAISIIVSVVGPITASASELVTPPGQPVEAVVKARFNGVPGTRGQSEDMVGTIVFDWLSKEEERSDYVVSFKSGALVAFEICSGQVVRTRKNGESDVFDCSGKTTLDTNQIPMAVEYLNLFADAMRELTAPHRTGDELVSELEFLPFRLCMDLYRLAQE